MSSLLNQGGKIFSSIVFKGRIHWIRFNGASKIFLIIQGYSKFQGGLIVMQYISWEVG